MYPAQAQHENFITNSFRNDIYVRNRMDVEDTPLWDTVEIAANTAVDNNNLVWFENVGAGSGKNLADTNMQQPNRLPSPKAFSIFGIRAYWRSDMLLADAINVTNELAISLSVGDKVYNIAPTWYYPQAGGLFGTLSNDASAAPVNISILNNGVPTRESMHRLAIPIVLENGQTFRVTGEGPGFTTNAGGTGVRITILFHGLFARGVQ